MRPRPTGSVRTKAAWLAAALASGPSGALGDDPPPLSGPEGGPVLEAPSASVSGPAPISTAPAPRPDPAPTAPRPSTRARDDRPVLALPGVTMPTARPLPPAEPMPPSLGPTLEARPPILPPATSPGAGASRATPSGPATALPALPSSRFRGRVIESTPAGEADLMPPIDVPPPGAGTIRRSSALPPLSTGPARIDDLPELKESTGRDPSPDLDRAKGEADEKDRPRDWSKPLAPRRPNMFGNRWTNPFLGRPIGESGSDIRAEPRSDPAADAALKRRIEKQAEAVVGDRVRRIDVRVVGRSVTIQAHGARIFQRRAVKRSLETLPGLSGYRASVELVD